MPVVLPKPSDPRLHLAAVITSLQVIGQVAFHFRLSIAQILLSLGTCAVLEIAITARRQKVWMWPASALLTGNGVAFILRVPGTEHGDWWSLHGWWIFVGTSAISLLSKYVIVWRGGHVFNPSNFGLVLCFVALGRSRAEPLDFWWGPMSWWLAASLAIIVAGGFLILRRLKLLVVAVGFWVSFAAGIAVLCLMGHTMVARWHLGPIEGWHFWWVLLTSPEVLVFLFYMITDPKTAPREQGPRLRYAVAIGLLATLLIAPMQTEWASKVALLASLAIVCAARPVLDVLRVRVALRPALGLAGVAVYAVVLFAAGIPARTESAAAAGTFDLRGQTIPPIELKRSDGVDQQLTMPTAMTIAGALARAVPTRDRGVLQLWLERGLGQSGPTAVARLDGKTYKLSLVGPRWTLQEKTKLVVARTRQVTGYDFSQTTLDFQQGSFLHGMSDDPAGMMGGGVCWLDANGDGRLDLFAVNGYDDPHVGDYATLPRSVLFLNEGGGRFVPHPSIAVRGEGCVAGDLDGDGRPDLFVTTASDDVLLWNEGGGRFVADNRRSGIASFGWHSGAAIADVNGDGRMDLYVGGYTNEHGAIPGSMRGYPSNHLGVHDELFLNLSGRKFRNVAAAVGLDRFSDHSLGAAFFDANDDGRIDLYVANDEDPNRLYLNEPGGKYGFHLVDVAKRDGIADTNAGMGVAIQNGYLFVSNSRTQGHAIFRDVNGTWRNERPAFAPAFGTSKTGWGDSWIDLRNTGTPDLVLANGNIPIKSLQSDAKSVQVVARTDGVWARTHVLQGLVLNGRAVAAGDFDNDGRVDMAISSIGGPLVLVHNKSESGHWLTVDVRPFAPGAVVTVVDSSGRTQSRTVQAGSSYLSSEDPRPHFGFGAATPVRVTVRYPGGVTRTLRPKADRIVTVTK